jgi:NAD(P)-dependent dehydrogenase (short-subunit alcohol dehydrogenase family)
MNFTDKKVLITGGSRGIGYATAQAFLALGARVAINGRTEQSVAAAITRLAGGDRLVAAAGNVGTVAGCETAVNTAIEELGGLDVLVNCAGICVDSTIEETDETMWDETFNINLKGTFFCVRAALPALRKNSGSSIINMASVAGLQGYAEGSIYCASKGGVVNLTRALAMELAPDIRVNCVCPGWVDTDMLRRDYIDIADDPAEAEREAMAEAPLERVSTPEEIASAIIYLASHDARFITGVALPLDGGLSAGRSP